MERVPKQEFIEAAYESIIGGTEPLIDFVVRQVDELSPGEIGKIISLAVYMRSSGGTARSGDSKEIDAIARRIESVLTPELPGKA